MIRVRLYVLLAWMASCRSATLACENRNTVGSGSAQREVKRIKSKLEGGIRRRRDLKPLPHPSSRSKPSARRAESSRQGHTYRVGEVDAAPDDLAAAAGHDGDLHASSPPGAPLLCWWCSRSSRQRVGGRRRR